MRRILIAAGILFGLSLPAWATCPTPLTAKDAGGTTQNLSTTDDAGGNCLANMVIQDYAGTNQASVNSSHQILVAPLVAGSAIVGKFGIDQTTPGTTNAASIANIGANTASAGAGAVGTGSLRIAVGQDTTTVAGSAPGVAGTPSANVLSVQGAASMTPLKVDPSGVTSPVSVATAPALVAGSAIIGKVGIDQTTPGTTNGVVCNSGCSSAGGTNPTSTLTTPVTVTTAYAAAQNIATSATGTSVSVPSFSVSNNSGGGATIPRVRLSVNDTATTAWPGAVIQVDLWSSAPTFAAGNGDRGTFKIATGSASHLGSFSCLMSPAVQGDGYYGECYANVGNFVTLGNLSTVDWTLDAISGGGVVTAARTFTLAAEVHN